MELVLKKGHFAHIEQYMTEKKSQMPMGKSIILASSEIDNRAMYERIMCLCISIEAIAMNDISSAVEVDDYQDRDEFLLQYKGGYLTSWNVALDLLYVWNKMTVEQLLDWLVFGACPLFVNEIATLQMPSPVVNATDDLFSVGPVDLDQFMGKHGLKRLSYGVIDSPFVQFFQKADVQKVYNAKDNLNAKVVSVLHNNAEVLNLDPMGLAAVFKYWRDSGIVQKYADKYIPEGTVPLSILESGWRSATPKAQ